MADLQIILAGDTGGTSTRLAYFELKDGRLVPVVVQQYRSREYRGLNEIVRTFVGAHPMPIAHAAFGIAGPVRGGRVQTPNLPWVVDGASLAGELGLPSVSLLNDLEANTYGVLALEPKDFALINAGVADPQGNVAVISAGTGLGEAGAIWDGARLTVFASEGGHSDFAPRNELEAELMLYVRKKYGEHASYERVLSGPGLYNVYQFLRDTGRGTEEDWLRDAMGDAAPAATISQMGLEGKSELCVRALDLFITLYGAEAGNWALKIKSTGGVYIGGGIAPKLLPKLQSRLFMDAFMEKGRLSTLLEAMPVAVVLNDQAALIGSAHLAAEKAGVLAPR